MREDFTTPIHRTKIIPLRWLANNVFHTISMFFFRIGLRYNDRIEWDKDYKWHNRFMEAFGFRLYKLFNYPYEWWGTIYRLNLEEMLKDMDLSGPEWDDYDENGVPYWEKTGTVDPDYSPKFVDGGIIPETDAMGREKFWEDLGRREDGKNN